MFVILNVTATLHLSFISSCFCFNTLNMEGSNSCVGSHEEVKYSHLQDDERSDCNNIVLRREPRSRHWLSTFLFAINCFALIGLLFITSQLLRRQSSICSTTNDVGSNLLRDDDLSIINRIATNYHYLENGYDDSDFTVGDSYWSDMFPGIVLWKSQWAFLPTNIKQVGDGIVFLHQDYIDSRRLPHSAVSPNRKGNRSVYEIAAYHSLHCLVSSSPRENLLH